MAEEDKKPEGESSGGIEEIQRSETAKKPLPNQDVTALLQQLALAQPDRRKSQEDYKFWNTQPVVKFSEQTNLLDSTTAGSDGEALPEGAIIPDEVCRATAKPTSARLPEGFEWCDLDLSNKAELQEFYDLLFNHYVEDSDGSFRFNYSPEFLDWALKPPGWKKEWHIGVRTKSTAEGKPGKLIASITGIPVTLKVRQASFKAVEVNFLAIHRKLRSKRLAPVLIREITRRCYLLGIYQALYTAGTLLPTPASTCRYFHRSLDWEHLNNMGFSHLPPGSTPLRQKLKYKVETSTLTKGLRAMKQVDIPAVKDLLIRYGERFDLRQDFSTEEISHWLCSNASKNVVWTYVVEEKGKITDFFSYYLLESTVLHKKNTIRAAYLYYYASETAFKGDAADKSALQARLQQLVHDALIQAKKDNFHVFNALSLLDNPLFLREEKFEPGDGKLHYYLYNWRTALLNNGLDSRNQIDANNTGGVGVVML